jgi:TonB family protein
MTTIESWLLGYLVNAVWQGAVLCAAAWLLARAMRSLGPRVEHRIWCVALVAQALLPMLLVRPVSLVWGGRQGGGPGLVTVVTGEGVIAGGVRLPVSLLAVVAGLYLAVVLCFALRLAWNVWRTLAWARQVQPMELEGAAAGTWVRCCERFHVQTAGACVSDSVSGPVTVGILRRIVIFPSGFVEQTDATGLAAAMAHECAHMQRHDFAKNLLYEALLLPVAWHPAAWLTRARVAESREMVCDAMAAEAMATDAMAGRQVYARALLRLAATIVERGPRNNLHAIGVFDANRLEERTMRLTERRLEVTGARRLAMAALCVAAGIGTMAAAAELRVSVAMPVAQQSAAAEEARSPRVGAGVMAGNILTRVNPVYPQAAKDAKVQGAVLLKAVIGKDGTIHSLQLISGPEELAPSALDAVRQWVYKPYLLNGQPTEVETTITVNYSLAK